MGLAAAVGAHFIMLLNCHPPWILGVLVGPTLQFRGRMEFQMRSGRQWRRNTKREMEDALLIPSRVRQVLLLERRLRSLVNFISNWLPQSPENLPLQRMNKTTFSCRNRTFPGSGVAYKPHGVMMSRKDGNKFHQNIERCPKRSHRSMQSFFGTCSVAVSYLVGFRALFRFRRWLSRRNTPRDRVHEPHWKMIM